MRNMCTSWTCVHKLHSVCTKACRCCGQLGKYFCLFI